MSKRELNKSPILDQFDNLIEYNDFFIMNFGAWSPHLLVYKGRLENHSAGWKALAIFKRVYLNNTPKLYVYKACFFYRQRRIIKIFNPLPILQNFPNAEQAIEIALYNEYYQKLQNQTIGTF